jgi:hypothetical protein
MWPQPSRFEGFVERKWHDALNIAAAEPASWRGDGEKVSSGARPPDGTAAAGRGVLKITGAVNVVEQGAPPRSPSPSSEVSFRRKCRARNLIGCDGDHVMLQCKKLMSLELSERKEVLKKSGLCTICLKHAAELECYGRGSMSKPRCVHPGCDGEHTPSVHKLMGEESAGVNLVAEGESEDEDKDEDEGWWVRTVGVTEMPDREEEDRGEVTESELEEEVHCVRVESSYGPKEGPEYPPGDCFADETTEGEWWNPGPIQPYSVGGWGRSPALPREAASPQRANSCSDRAPPYGVVVVLHEHQAEEVEEEAGGDRRSGLGGGQARRLVEADAQ